MHTAAAGEANSRQCCPRPAKRCGVSAGLAVWLLGQCLVLSKSIKIVYNVLFGKLGRQTGRQQIAAQLQPFLCCILFRVAAARDICDVSFNDARSPFPSTKSRKFCAFSCHQIFMWHDEAAAAITMCLLCA